MEMGASNPHYSAGRMEELQKENAELREQLRKYAAAHTVSRGALVEAATEKEATARIAHQVAVEERATRTAVEVAGSQISLAVVMQILTFLLAVVICAGLFFWLPKEIQAHQSNGVTNVITPGAPAAAPTRVVIPGR